MTKAFKTIQEAKGGGYKIKFVSCIQSSGEKSYQTKIYKGNKLVNVTEAIESYREAFVAFTEMCEEYGVDWETSLSGVSDAQLEQYQKEKVGTNPTFHVALAITIEEIPTDYHSDSQSQGEYAPYKNCQPSSLPRRAGDLFGCEDINVSIKKLKKLLKNWEIEDAKTFALVVSNNIGAYPSIERVKRAEETEEISYYLNLPQYSLRIGLHNLNTENYKGERNRPKNYAVTFKKSLDDDTFKSCKGVNIKEYVYVNSTKERMKKVAMAILKLLETGIWDKNIATPDYINPKTDKKPLDGLSGYTERSDGSALSTNAEWAENQGKYPKVRFCRAYNVALSDFRVLLDLGIIYNSEWHHTGKRFSKTVYYCWGDNADYSNDEFDEDTYASIYQRNKKRISKLVKDIARGNNADANMLELLNIFGVEDAADVVLRKHKEKELKSEHEQRMAKFDQKVKEFEKWYNKALSDGRIVKRTRLKDEPKELWITELEEQYGKYGWFVADKWRYRLPIYYSGIEFKDNRTYNEYWRQFNKRYNLDGLGSPFPTLAGTESNVFREQYRVVDCEHEGDIDAAKREVEQAGGIVDDVYSELKDTDERIDDYYESREWYILFHCNTKEQLIKTCQKLGIGGYEEIEEKPKPADDKIKRLRLMKMKALARASDALNGVIPYDLH